MKATLTLHEELRNAQKYGYSIKKKKRNFVSLCFSPAPIFDTNL